MITKPKKETAPVTPKQRYYEGIGGRKTAIARARIVPSKGHITINGKTVKEYFASPMHQETALAALTLTSLIDHSSASVHVRGGGIVAQAEAVRHGIARALVAMDEQYKKVLRAAGFLTRDARVVERKKPGLKKARKAPQWAKR